MQIGVTALATDETMSPTELARAVEERGLKSLFLPEHTHVPTSRLTPYPGGGSLREEVKRLVDPIVGLATAASVTDNLELGTGILLVAQHDPIILAKQIATLDHLSGGRVVLGVGFGWNAEEMLHHRVSPRQKGAVVREHSLAMIDLWTHDVASFEGEHVSFSSSWQWPKPLRRPHPPILLGGPAGDALFRHIIEYGDGWLPMTGSGLEVHQARLRQMAEQADRDPSTVSVNIFGAKPDPRRLEYYQRLGVERVVLALPPAERFADVGGISAAEALPILDSYANLSRAFGD